MGGRNLPGLLELILLQKLPLDAGARHAITTVIRYAFTAACIAVACHCMGIGWSSVQWLIAALTVGLGFGLQEIFANFVSGLILLIERPIRIGDVVTIDGVTGTISRIQIRATTIVDLENKEFVVPNKEFVTGRLLNWTLSNKSIRVVIEVGVAYGTDTDKARKILADVAYQHPDVQNDPEPIATFDGFGDSSLNLALRCYLPDVSQRLKTITELHEQINQAFAKGGIEIPFPQLDLHLPANSVATAPVSTPREAA